MRRKLTDEFEALYEKYEQATATEDRMIRTKLNEICLCYGECNADERPFTNEIINKFCQLIALMEKNAEKKRAEEASVTPSSNAVHFLSQTALQPHPQQIYTSSETLLKDFHRYLSHTHKESTAKDYTARIKTFADGYLSTVPQVWQIYSTAYEAAPVDAVLFTYGYLELIIAGFSVKDPDGTTNKQRNNLRSALRKFNEFKQRHQTDFR